MYQASRHNKGVKWDGRFLSMAALIAGWSKEPNTKVGCVIVDDKRRVVATGYNGFARGTCDDESIINDPAKRDLKLAVTLHAEENALLVVGKSVEGCTAYVTHPPCSLCAARLIQSGIRRVVYTKLTDESFKARWGASIDISRELANQAGMMFEESI